jgi:hypothetical protein
MELCNAWSAKRHCPPLRTITFSSISSLDRHALTCVDNDQDDRERIVDLSHTPSTLTQLPRSCRAARAGSSFLAIQLELRSHLCRPGLFLCTDLSRSLIRPMLMGSLLLLEPPGRPSEPAAGVFYLNGSGLGLARITRPIHLPVTYLKHDRRRSPRAPPRARTPRKRCPWLENHGDGPCQGLSSARSGRGRLQR